MAPTIITRLKLPAVPSFQGAQQYDLVALDDVKLELKIETSKDDAWLKKVITRESAAVAHFCNRHFQVQTYEDECWAFRDPYPYQLPSGFMPLQLRRRPLVALPSEAHTAPPGPFPVLSQAPGGALPATRYYVKMSYVTEGGETAAGAEANLLVSAGNLLSVASPPMDNRAAAIGWNCYVGTTSFGESLQNDEPLAIDASFMLATSGLVSGAPGLPPYTLVVERGIAPGQVIPRALAEGWDFEADRETAQLTRLLPDHYPGRWPGVPITVAYLAGFAEIPADVQDATIMLLKERWFARHRDPNIRSEEAAGVYSAQYWFGTGPGGPADLPAFVAERLSRYRAPVIA